MPDSLPLLLFQAAYDSLGIYPIATICSDVEIPRTEWQDGWNAAVSEVQSRYIKLNGWASNLSPANKTSFNLLLEHDVIDIDFDGEQVHMTVNVNDIFFPAAHSEEAQIKDLEVLALSHMQFGDAGIYAWVGNEINMEPRRPDAKYAEALTYIKEKNNAT